MSPPASSLQISTATSAMAEARSLCAAMQPQNGLPVRGYLLGQDALRCGELALHCNNPIIQHPGVGYRIAGIRADAAARDPLPCCRLVAVIELAQLRLQPLMLGDDVSEPVNLLGRRFGFAAGTINSSDRLAQPVTRRRQRVGSRISSGEGERVGTWPRVMVLWRKPPMMPLAAPVLRPRIIIVGQQGPDNPGYPTSMTSGISISSKDGRPRPRKQTNSEQAAA